MIFPFYLEASPLLNCMRISCYLRIGLSLVALGISVTTAALAGFSTPQLDHPFQQFFNQNVRSLALQNDGKILVGGGFSIVSSWSSYPYLVRLESSTGEIDHSFRADSVGPVTHIAARNDGSIVVAGSFTRIGGPSVSSLAILGPDGRLQSRFNFTPSGPVTALFVKPDGKILIAGSGTSAQGAFYWIVQTSAAGTYHGPFSTINGPVYSIAAKSDGRILLGGQFSSVGNKPRNNLAQLSSTGQVDVNFNVTVNAKVSGIEVQADDKIFLAGDFTQIGNMARNRLGRISSTGVPDTSFLADINLNGPVESMALQANGNLIIGGGFSFKAAVLGNTGNLVANYDSGSFESVSALALDGEGRLLVGTYNSPTQSMLERFQVSAPSTQTLTATSPSRIEWTRTGALPELDSAQVDLWTDNSWTPLGAMTRTPGGWEKTGLTLPLGSWLRTQGSYQCGQSNGSRSPIEVIRSYGDVPDIAVEDANGTPVSVSGTTVSFGSQDWLTAGSQRIFTVRNTGAGFLTNLSVSVADGHAGDFVITPPASSSLAAGASTTLGITFFPRGGGTRQARLVIQSNDYDEASFDVILSGIGIHQDTGYLPSFNDDSLNSLALLSDGSVIVGGRFTQVNGLNRSYLTKLRPDGSLDPSFSVNVSGQIYVLRVQSDGKILIVGDFTSVNGFNLPSGFSKFVRLQPNGELDLSFAPGAQPSGSGVIQLLPTGKILIITAFNDTEGAPRNRVTRLNSDGSIDESFSNSASITSKYDSIYGMALQEDGKILVIGNISSVGGVSRSGAARLLPDGLVDETFAPPTTISAPSSMALQADGKILLAGLVKNVNFTGVYGIIRLLPNGANDGSFNATGNGSIMGIQTDGRIWVSGTNGINNSSWNGFRRLLPDGTEDDTMDVRASSTVSNLTQTSNGSILVAGSFTDIGGVNRDRLARLPNDISASQSFTATSPSRIEWLRSGSSPEVSQVMIEKWNGSAWVRLGSASRITGGWELSGLTLGASGYLRARGSSAYAGASSHSEHTLSYNFTGANLTSIQQWRVIQFGTHQNTGAAANDQDFDNDGVANIVEYAMGSSPIDASSSARPQSGWESVGEADRFFMSFSKASSALGIEIIPESSQDLATWYADAAHVTIVENSSSLLKFRATDPDGLAFLRVRVIEVPTGNPPN